MTLLLQKHTYRRRTLRQEDGFCCYLFLFLNLVKVKTSYHGVFFSWLCKQTVRGCGCHGILLLNIEELAGAIACDCVPHRFALNEPYPFPQHDLAAQDKRSTDFSLKLKATFFVELYKTFSVMGLDLCSSAGCSKLNDWTLAQH